MANMVYCRFQNTLADLDDCFDHINDRDLSDAEKNARKHLLALCAEICDDAGMFDNEDNDEGFHT